MFADDIVLSGREETCISAVDRGMPYTEFQTVIPENIDIEAMVPTWKSG